MITDTLIIPVPMQSDLLRKTATQVQPAQHSLIYKTPPAITRGLDWLGRLFGGRTRDGGFSIEDQIQLLYTEQALFFTTTHLKSEDIQEIISTSILDTDLDHIAAIQWIKEMTNLPQHRIAALFGVSRQTLSSWLRKGPIADTKYRRVLAVHDVLRRASLRHSGRNQLRAWLDTPQGVDGHTPAELLGMGEVERARLLARLNPSPSLSRPIVRTPEQTAAQFRPYSTSFAMPSAVDNDEDLISMYGDPLEDNDEESEDSNS